VFSSLAKRFFPSAAVFEVRFFSLGGLLFSHSFFLFQGSILDYGQPSWALVLFFVVVVNSRTLVLLENTSNVLFHCPPPQRDTME